MSGLYPLLLLPDFRERVWGARDLSPIYSHQAAEGQPVGEVWLTGEDCRVANGPLSGKTLAEVCQAHGVELVGDAARDPSRFPLLVKFLFPRERLSVQVHPDDAAARRAGQACGKTECWYVLAAEPGAQIALGLKAGTTHQQVEEAIRQSRLEELLNWIAIAPGEMFYADAGTVHAIGPGSVLVETQQNSDTTYRLYDYGRGRELHVQQGLAAMKEWTRAGKVRPESNGAGKLISAPCFVVEKFTLAQPVDLSQDAGGRSSVHALVAIDGCGVVEADGAQPVSFARGQAVVLPASVRNYRVRPQWQLEILRASLPGGEVAEPETAL